jgi:predicted DNA-binding protein YlxM (UPF0122 family)
MMAEQMDLSQRDEKIYELSVQGVSFAEIARTFNLSRERVRQIYWRTKDRKENYDSWPPLKKILSNRSRNALVGHFNGEAILGNPKKISEIGGDELVRIKNIGQKSMRELASALNSLGFIKCENSWLLSYELTSSPSEVKKN